MSSGRFRPGQSGNPAGRPVGSTSPSTRLRQAIAEHVPAIIESLVREARNGDVAAASLLLSRVLPPVRPESVVTPIFDSGDMAGRAETIVGEALSGAISPTVANELIGALAAQAKIVEISVLAERLDALEERIGK